jgi:hypothetical protein
MSVKIFKFKSRGHGLVATQDIKHKTFIGNYFEKDHQSNEIPRYIYDGWFEHPFFGRYINHNKTPNCNLILNGDYIQLIANQDILKNKEITVNYFDIVDLLNLPESEVKKHGIVDFEYIIEDIDLDKKQII